MRVHLWPLGALPACPGRFYRTSLCRAVSHARSWGETGHGSTTQRLEVSKLLSRVSPYTSLMGERESLRAIMPADDMGRRLQLARERREEARTRLFGAIDIQRAEVIRALQFGMSRAQVAASAGVSVVTVEIWAEQAVPSTTGENRYY